MRTRRGFAAVDVLVGGLTLSVLAVLLLVAGRQTRGNAWQAGSMANLHEFAAVTASYGADYSDQYWSYTWRPSNQGDSQFADLNAMMATTSTLVTAAVQAADIARRRGVPDFPASNTNTWLPFFMCGHWVLSDYLDQPLALPFAVSPGDRNLAKWSKDPAGFRAGAYQPAPDGADPFNMRYAYGMSYRMSPSFYSADYTATGGAGPSAIVFGGTYGIFQWINRTNDVGFGGRRSSEVRYPSQKVFMWDSAQWAGAKRPLFWLEGQAKVPMLFVDGSVQARVSGKSNRGFNPDQPQNAFSVTVSYQPMAWDPPTPAGNYSTWYLFTRGGLKGRDYDGTEPSGPPF